MSGRIHISTRAEMDLAHQYSWYLDHAGVDIAERFLTAFDATIGKIAAQPTLGRLRKFRAPELGGIRSFPVGNRFGAHLIFYRSIAGSVGIERVMHGARDLPRRLVEPPI